MKPVVASDTLSASGFILSQLQEYDVAALEIGLFADNQTPCLEIRFNTEEKAQEFKQFVDAHSQTGDMPLSEDKLSLYLDEAASNNLFASLSINPFVQHEPYFTSLLNKKKQQSAKVFALQELSEFTVTQLAIVSPTQQSNEYRLQLVFTEQKQANEFWEYIAYYNLDKGMLKSQDGLSLIINKQAADELFTKMGVAEYEQGKSLFASLLAEYQPATPFLAKVTEQFNRQLEAEASLQIMLPKGEQRFKPPYLSIAVHACSPSKGHLLNQWLGYNPKNKTRLTVTSYIAPRLFRNIGLETLGKIKSQDTYTVLVNEYIHTLAKNAKRQGYNRQAIAEIASAILSLQQEIIETALQSNKELKQVKANGLMELLALLGEGQDMLTAIQTAKKAYPELTDKALLKFTKGRVEQLLDMLGQIRPMAQLANNANSLNYHKSSLLDKLSDKFNQRLGEKAVALHIVLHETNYFSKPLLKVNVTDCSEQASTLLKQWFGFEHMSHNTILIGAKRAQQLCKDLGMETHGQFKPQPTYMALIKEHINELTKQAKHQGHAKTSLAEIVWLIDELYKDMATTDTKANLPEKQLQLNALIALLENLTLISNLAEATSNVKEQYTELNGSLQNTQTSKLLAALNQISPKLNL
jgi:hypothetical protein